MTRPTDNRFLFWIIIASQFAPPFMFSGVAIALPSMGADLNAGARSLGLVETLFLAGSLAFLLPVGRLADATDKRSLYKLGMLGFGVSSIVIASLSSMTGILIVRFIQGITSAIFAATGPAILADIVPVERRSRAYGNSIGVIYAGLMLGPIIAGYLVHFWNWRAVFLAGAVILLLMFALVAAMLPSAWRRPARVVHMPSAALMLFSVMCIVIGAALLKEGILGYCLLVAGGLMAGAFVAMQRHLERPLIDVVALSRHRELRNALIVQALIYINAYSSMFMLSLYMQVSRGVSSEDAGKVMAVGSLIMAFTSPVAGRLSERFRPRNVSIAGVACVFVSALLATSLAADGSRAFVALILSVQGLGFALFSTPNMTIIMNSVDSGQLSMASALSAKSRSMGMICGMVMMTILITLAIGSDSIQSHAAEFIGTVTTGFSIMSMTGAIALVVCFLIRGETTVESARAEPS